MTDLDAFFYDAVFVKNENNMFLSPIISADKRTDLHWTHNDKIVMKICRIAIQLDPNGDLQLMKYGKMMRIYTVFDIHI